MRLVNTGVKKGDEVSVFMLGKEESPVLLKDLELVSALMQTPVYTDLSFANP